MKEATGELSMTAVVVVIIGILAVALPIIVRSVIKTTTHNANCSAAYGCSTCDSSTRLKTCYYTEDSTDGGTKETEIKCSCSSSDAE